jgi:hypothetical protein
MKNGINYINLESVFFAKFFNLPETLEFNSNENIIEDVVEENTEVDEILNINKKKNDELVDTCSDTNSELSYELYCYSDEDP